MPKAACFDLDGTLVDSRGDIAVSANAVRQGLGLDALPVETVAGYVGDGLGKLLERLVPDDSDLAAARLAFATHYDRQCTQATWLYPGLDTVLQQLVDRGWLLAVVSNKPARWCRAIIDANGLSRIFPVVVGGDGVRKPDPEPVLAALAALDAAPACSWMVGDHGNDVLAGRAAGCRSCAVTWGYGETQAFAPDASVDRPADLVDVIAPP